MLETFCFFSHRPKFLVAASAHGAAGSSEDNFETGTELRLGPRPGGERRALPLSSCTSQLPAERTPLSPAPPQLLKKSETAAGKPDQFQPQNSPCPAPAAELSLPCPSCASTQLLRSKVTFGGNPEPRHRLLNGAALPLTVCCREIRLKQTPKQHNARCSGLPRQCR